MIGIEWRELAWVLAAALLGFAASFTLAGRLRLSRDRFVLPFGAAVVLFAGAYAAWTGIDLAAFLLRGWAIGLAAAMVVGVVVVLAVVRQPESPRPTGARLLRDVAWLGVVYGALDALLLVLLPAVAATRALEGAGADLGWWARAAVAILAILATAVVTAAYHLGYPEFRGPALGEPVLGNMLLAAAFVLTGSPLAPLLGHVILHMTAVLHGVATVIQLPPHYRAPLAPEPFAAPADASER